MAFESIIGRIQEAPIYILLPALLIAIFIILAVLHIVYNRKKHKINPYTILILGYFLLIINILLKTEFYSIEWAFLGFVIVAVLYYDFKVDSRFLILPAILLLGYVPFLLIGKQDAIAETVAIYVYYFLVVGVVLQLIEHVKKIENSVDFSRIMKKIVYKIRWIYLIIPFGLIYIAIILGNRFYNLELWKWTSVYVFAVIMVFYVLSWIKEDTQKQEG